jgi:FolB domain-containing protein
VVIDLELWYNLDTAAERDDLSEAVDYSGLSKKVRRAVQRSGCQLIEALALLVARVCLENKLVTAVTVTVHKPGAIRKSGAPAVRLHRKRDEYGQSC